MKLSVGKYKIVGVAVINDIEVKQTFTMDVTNSVEFKATNGGTISNVSSLVFIHPDTKHIETNGKIAFANDKYQFTSTSGKLVSDLTIENYKIYNSNNDLMEDAFTDNKINLIAGTYKIVIIFPINGSTITIEGKLTVS